jgi:hypothetical protein
MDEWHSVWKPAYDNIVATDPTPHVAVAKILEFGEHRKLPTPRFYVSTAITSAGWRRDPELRDPTRISEAITRNNRTASLILGELVANANSLVTERSMMVPTDLEKVPSWDDTDYLIFYFAWSAGLNADGAERFARSFNEDQYTPILTAANNRKLTNDQRWPAYQLFTEVAVTKLRLTESNQDTRAGDEAHTLLQLIDVGESLGCRAERLFADARGLDINIHTFEDELPGELGTDVDRLRDLKASVGAARTDIELTPISLR